MSVPNQTPYIIYNANGLTTVFPFEFYIINSGDIQVSLNGEVITTGYSVSGVGNVGGGDVTFLTPPANGMVVMLERVVPTYRLTDYQDNGDLLADTVNKDFDRLWMAIQRSFTYLGLALRRPLFGGPFDAEGFRIAKLGDPVNQQDAATKKYVDNIALSRVLRVPESYVDVLPAVDQRANKLLAFNNAGKPIAVLPPSGSASDVLIELAKPTGAGLIGTEDGFTVQDELNTTNSRIDNQTAVTPTHVKIFAELPIRPDSYDAIVNQYGYSYLYPQGLAFCDVDREIYICAQGPNGTNSWCWIYVFDVDTKELKSTFSAGDYNAEGLHITYIDGKKYLFILDYYSDGGNGKTGVYELPEDISSIDLQRLTAIRVCNTQHYFQMGGFGEQIIIEVNAGNSSERSLQRRTKANYYNARDLISSSDPVPVGSVSFKWDGVTSGKRQALAIGDSIIMAGCGGYHQRGSELSSENLYGCRTYTAYGEEVAAFTGDPNRVCDILDKFLVETPERIENEGACFSSVSGRLSGYTLHLTKAAGSSSSGGMVLLEQMVNSGARNAIDLTPSLCFFSVKDNFNDSKIQLCERPYDRQQNKQLTTLKQILDRMNRDGIQIYRFYNSASWPVEDVNGNIIQSPSTITIHNNNSFTYTITIDGDEVQYSMLITGSSGGPYTQSTSLHVTSKLSSVRPEFLKLGSVYGVNGIPCTNIYSDTANSMTVFRFISGDAATGGNLSGNISFDGTTTTYATSSDIRKKNINSVYSNGLDNILKLYRDEALCSYAWKSTGESDYGLLAQRLKKTIPRAVHIDENGEYFVDYSKVIPDILSAIVSLANKIK